MRNFLISNGIFQLLKVSQIYISQGRLYSSGWNIILTMHQAI